MQFKDWKTDHRMERPLKKIGAAVSSGAPSYFAKRPDLSDQFYVYCVQAFFSVLKIKLHVIVFFDLVDQTAGMNEGFFAGVIMFDKSKSFVSVEKLYGACCLVVHH
jgi:hypothetical protein